MIEYLNRYNKKYENENRNGRCNNIINFFIGELLLNSIF